MTNFEEKLTDSWIFYALVGVLGMALLVFIILFVCCVVGMNKKTQRQNRYYQRNVVFQTPIVAPKSRRYSKSNSREDHQTVSTVGPDVRNPTRYVWTLSAYNERQAGKHPTRYVWTQAVYN